LEGAIPTENDAAAGIPFEVSMPITQSRAIAWMLCGFPSSLWRRSRSPRESQPPSDARSPTQPGLRSTCAGFDGRVIGAHHNGEIVRIPRASADRTGKPWAYVAYETNGEGWVYWEFIICY
jgi:hypothetical protein